MKKSDSLTKKILKIIFGNILGMALFLALCIFGGLFLVDHYTLHGKYVEMPDLRGENAKVAVLKLKSLGLTGEVADTGYVTTQAGDIILDQSIRPGKRVKPGRWIHLVVNSDKERRIALPADIAGNCSLREAEMKLRSRGFSITPPQYVLGDKNWVYEIKVNNRVVAPGAMISVRTPVTLVVGDGKIEEEYSGGDDFYEEVFTDSVSGGSIVVDESEGDDLFE